MARRRIKSYKAEMESLERRQMLSVKGESVLPIAAAAESTLAIRHDLDAYAEGLLEHPQQAAKQGLGALVTLLRENSKLAAQDGWGTVLATELADHPRYTAAHHLTGLLTPPATTQASGSAPTASAAKAPSITRRPDLDAIAKQIVQHPKQATKNGLGALVTLLQKNSRLAAQEGWGTVLAMVLKAHPRYTAAHHLTGLLDPATSEAAVKKLTTPPASTKTGTASSPSITPKSTPPATPPIATTGTASPPTTGTGSAPANPPASTGPVKVAADDPTVNVGGVLRALILPGGVSGTGATYTITPQPLPDHMTFNRGTGVLTFAPAPGQEGTYAFNVTASNGTQSFVEPVTITVSATLLPTTELSGEVVGEAGKPLAGMPVSVGGISTTTDQNGDFTLAGIPANATTLSAGGSVASAQGRQPLMAPVSQLLGHEPYADVDNLLIQPLILPQIRWSAATQSTHTAAAPALGSTNASAAGAGASTTSAPTAAVTRTVGATTTSVPLELAELGPHSSAQHMPDGVSGPMLLYKSHGVDLTKPVQLTLPNTTGQAPGTTVGLVAMNPQTGGHDVVGLMVVSADGRTLTSIGSVVLSSTGPHVGKKQPGPVKHEKGGGSLAGGSGQTGLSGLNSVPIKTQGIETGGGTLAGGSGRSGIRANIVVPGNPFGGGSAASTWGSSSSWSTTTSWSSTTTTTTTTTGLSFSGCLILQDSSSNGQPKSSCPECEAAAAAAAAQGNDASPPSASGGAGSGGAGSGGAGSGGAGSGGKLPNELNTPQRGMESDAGLVTGDYFLDHMTVAYSSQGQNRNIDLQYNSGQADPKPVVEFQFTTPLVGDSAAIYQIKAEVDLGGVIQGRPATFTVSGGLAPDTTYNIPIQVDASSLTTGAYPYTMRVKEYFGTSGAPTVITSNNDGFVNVVNESSDPMGAGWSVGGLQQLWQPKVGAPVLVTGGSQGTERFDTVSGSTLNDLALTAGIGNSHLFANNGAGGFTASTTTFTGGVTGTAAGDFNGDGLPDLAVVNSTTLAVLLNSGSGTFSVGSSISLPSGDEAKGVAVGNFTGHLGHTLDIAVLLAPTSGSGDYSVAIYTGNGDGTFTSPVVTSAGNGVSSTTLPNSIAVADFNNDGVDDLAFTTDNGLADVMLATGSGSMSSATTLTLPSGHLAYGLTSVDYNNDGKADLVVQANNTNVEEFGVPFAAVDLFKGNGLGGFTYTSMQQTMGQDSDPTYTRILGIVAGDFNGTAGGLEIGVPLTDGGAGHMYVDIIPLSTAGIWGKGQLHLLGSDVSSSSVPGNILAADLNGTGRPAIVVNNGDGTVQALLPDPDSNQFLPVETLSFGSTTGGSGSGGAALGAEWVAVAPFEGHTATGRFVPTTSDPSTLVYNTGGTWTRTYPDGTVIQFDSSGREVSQSDRNGNTTSYSYVPTGQPGAGSLETITDPVGLVTTLTYNVSGLLATITDPALRVTTITIDANDNLTKIVDPDSAVTQYGYSTPTNHEATSETSPNNHTATATYNSFGQLASETLFDGTSTTSIVPAQSQGLLTPGTSGPLPTTYLGSVTDPDNRTTTLAFNTKSKPTSQADSTGASTSTTYDQNGFVATVTDAMGRTATYTHDAKGNDTSIRIAVPTTSLGSGGSGGSGGGPTSYVETITYGVDSVPTSITDFNGNTTTFTLDSGGNVLRRTDPGGLHEDWTYNAAGQVLTDTDRNGKTTTYAYDSDGRLTTITYPGAGSPHVVYTYDSAGDVTSVTDEDGNTTTYTYDLAGRKLSSQDPVQALAGKATSYTYDADGNLQTVTDALGHVTSYAYNSRDELVGMTDAANQGTVHQTTYDYDADGNLKTVTNPDGKTTTYTYDDANRLNTVTDADGDTTTYTYDLSGLLTETQTPGTAPGHGPSVVDYSYDVDGRLHTKTLHQAASGGGSGGSGGTPPKSLVYTYGYDPNGNRTTVTDPLNHTTTYSYNNLNQQTAVTDAMLHTTSYGYDANGNLKTVTDANHDVTTNVYDVRDRLSAKTEASGGGTTTYTYDLAGNLKTVTDPDNNVTSYTYNATNRVATETSPTGGVTTYSYDLVGNLTQTIDPLGQIIDYGYDDDNRLTSETWHPVGGGSAFYTMTITYDPAGREQSIQDNNSSYAFTYTNAGRLLTVDDNGTTGLPQVTLTYSYDGDGNRASLRDSLGGVISYTRDLLDRLTVETQSGGSGIDPERVAFGYDDASNLTSLTRYSNLTGTSEVAQSVYQYDSADRLTTLTHKTSGGATIASYAYTLDPADRLTQEVKTWTTTGGPATDTITYGYTANGQLTSVNHTNGSFTNETFSYDANGNRNSTGHTTTAANELTTDGTYNYGYDADGNMTSKTDIATGDETLYVYDYENRLTEVDQVVGGVHSVVATYTYDALGRRIGTSGGGSTTWTMYDGNDPLLDFNGAGSVIARYLNGPSVTGVDAVLARDTSSGVAWYLPDRLGSIGDLIDNSGTVIDHIDYGAFGNKLNESNPSNGDRFQYAGMQTDAAIGLYYDNARWYDPQSGRFISQDPSGFSANDANLYRYVGNKPTTATDPTGLAEDDPTSMGGHRKNKRKSNRPKHQKGDERRKRDRGGEKKDQHEGWKSHKRVPVAIIGACGVVYVIYRIVRFAPSLLPPLWPTIPGNVVIP